MNKPNKVSILERIKKTSTIKEADVLSDSKLFKTTKEDLIPTSVKAINLALSGSFDGGLTAGHTVIAGPSRHFKSNIALLLASAYMQKYPDAVLMFYDSEFGSPQSYFKSFNIDMERVFHTPVTNIEKLKFDLMAQIEAIERGDKIIIVIDSIGNLASKKEVEDAIKQNTAADMSRAKAIKGLFRMVTPELALKNIPLVTIQHVYQEMCLSGDTIIMTSEGGKEISKIKVGDMVYAKTGLKKVTNTFGPDVLPKEGKRFLKLTFDDGSSVRCTDNHKFLVEDDRWVRAGELKIGQTMEKNTRKLVKVEEVEEFDLYDIEVEEDHCFELANGVIAHNSLFPKTIISGGASILLSANTAWIVGRRQNKVGTEVQGYHFIINVEKSRFIREKSQIPVSVNFDDGINTYSGLLDIAVAFGYVKKPKQGWYQPYNVESDTPLSQKMYREKETNTSEFWDNIFENTNFAEEVSNHYKLGGSSRLINFESPDPTIVSE